MTAGSSPAAIAHTVVTVVLPSALTPSQVALSSWASALDPPATAGSDWVNGRMPAGDVGVLRLAGAEIPVPRYGPQPPTRDSTGATDAMAQYAGQSAGAVREVRPAAEIVAALVLLISV